MGPRQKARNCRQFYGAARQPSPTERRNASANDARKNRPSARMRSTRGRASEINLLSLQRASTFKVPATLTPSDSEWSRAGKSSISNGTASRRASAIDSASPRPKSTVSPSAAAATCAGNSTAGKGTAEFENVRETIPLLSPERQFAFDSRSDQERMEGGCKQIETIHDGKANDCGRVSDGGGFPKHQDFLLQRGATRRKKKTFCIAYLERTVWSNK